LIDDSFLPPGFLNGLRRHCVIYGARLSTLEMELWKQGRNWEKRRKQQKLGGMLLSSQGGSLLYIVKNDTGLSRFCCCYTEIFDFA
jgi:hypothetical protein